jgi:hypothetical protein
MSIYLGYVIEQLIHEDEKLQTARAKRRKERRAARAQRVTDSDDRAPSRRILGWSSLAPKH